VTEHTHPDSIGRLRGGLIVSCQAAEDEPLHGPHFMAAMAHAAQLGGAVGIRANGPDDIAAIRHMVDLPIIGIWKAAVSGQEKRITPTIVHARGIAAAGAAIIALDATHGPHPSGPAADRVRAIKDALTLPVMADIATLDEGIVAAAAGADLIATTMSGYTPLSPHQDEPDLALVSALARSVPVPVIAEGRYMRPELVAAALDAGAWAVVVGTAITRPLWLTQQFARATRCQPAGAEDR